MTRWMIIPAAGTGSRLQSEIPKPLYPILGRPMISYVLHRYAPLMERFVIVVNPFSATSMESCRTDVEVPIDFVVQETPTGMLDAILLARDLVQRGQPAQVWITWCDQVAVSDTTVQRVADAASDPSIDLVMPTTVVADPYIHFARNEDGHLVGLRQRREGDTMPPVGEGDVGLFCLTRHAYVDLLPKFSTSAIPGQATRERNFLPFIPWLVSSRPGSVRTVSAADPIEAVGINDATDVARIEHHLRHA